MKVCHPSENYTSLNSLILQLQLMLELSLIQEILSTYTELFLLFAEYPYLFNFFKNEPIPLKGKNKLFYNNFITQDPARDGSNWYGYCGENPLTYMDSNGLETWRNSTLTREEYDKNYQLQRQYSWEQIQQHFSDNPNGIIYRYDTISYSLGTSNRDIPNMEKPSAELAWGLASLSKLAGSKIMSWIKNGITSAFASGVVDTSKQLTNMVKDENRTFDTNELFNATIGGGVAGFVTGGVASIPGGGFLSESIMLSNVVGGFSGSMTSQLLYNVQNGESLTNGMGTAYMYGAAGGLMVGGINICFPSLLPSNIGQVLRDSVRDEIVNTGTSQVIEEKINETRNN